MAISINPLMAIDTLAKNGLQAHWERTAHTPGSRESSELSLCFLLTLPSGRLTVLWAVSGQTRRGTVRCRNPRGRSQRTLPESLALPSLPGERRKHRAGPEICSPRPTPAPLAPTLSILASHLEQEVGSTDQHPRPHRGAVGRIETLKPFTVSFC